MVLKSSNRYWLWTLLTLIKQRSIKMEIDKELRHQKVLMYQSFVESSFRHQIRISTLNQHQYCDYVLICVSIHEGYVLYRCCISLYQFRLVLMLKFWSKTCLEFLLFYYYCALGILHNFILFFGLCEALYYWVTWRVKHYK